MIVATGGLLADRYWLDDLVAVGGMGQVWRGRDTVLEREVAVKVLRPELSDDPTVRARFRSEARHAAAVRHHGVATVHDYGEVPGPGSDVTAYLVMDYVDGQSLDRVLAERGRLAPDRTLDIAAQVSDALAAAHAAGLVHRDVKPGNLLLDASGHVTVTDFGIARAVDAAPVTATGLVMGTAEYLAPEQAVGRRANAATDVYALGVVAYEALSGHPPFHHGTPAEIAQSQVSDEVPALPGDVPGPVARLVLACLAKDPAERPDARSLSRRLRAVAAGTDDAADLAGSGRPGRRPASPTGHPGVPPGPAVPAHGGSALLQGEPRRDTAAIPAGRTRYGRPRGRRHGIARLRSPLLTLVLLVVLLLVAAALRAAGVLGAAPAPAGDPRTDSAVTSVASSPAPGHALRVAASRAATETKDGIG